MQAQTEVAPFRPGTTVDGVCYFLPKTVFRVAFISDKTVTTPGDFAAYADRFLRQPSTPRTETVEWRLKTFSLQPFGVPDSTKAYSIRLKSKTSAPLVTLSDDGLLLGYCARDGLCHARLTRVPLAWLYGPPREDDLTGFFKD